MRQMLPTKPLTSAILYGPGFFCHWKNFVLSDHGLKQAGLAPGPVTVFGPAIAAEAAKSAASASADTRSFMALSPSLRRSLALGAALLLRAMELTCQRTTRLAEPRCPLAC